MHSPTSVLTIGKLDRQTFEREIKPMNRPALMKGQVADWPSIALSQQSDEAVCGYLKTCDSGAPAGVLLGRPEIKGRFFYGETLKSFNFQQSLAAVSQALDRLLEARHQVQPPAIYVQSAVIGDHLPRFGDENILDLVAPEIAPRIWIGNALTVQTHQDPKYNIACCVAGKRRFTLYPPEQLSNLYIGPFEHTPAGRPISLVDPDAPDLERFPRFDAAQKTAQIAELGPGDALYIPYFWWHHVRSLEAFNILVNYWWDDAKGAEAAPYDCLLHALLSLRDLPADQRKCWKDVFDHYVFGVNGDPVAHLRPEDKGVNGPLSHGAIFALKRQLADRLQQK